MRCLPLSNKVTFTPAACVPGAHAAAGTASTKAFECLVGRMSDHCLLDRSQLLLELLSGERHHRRPERGTCTSPWCLGVSSYTQQAYSVGGLWHFVPTQARSGHQKA